MYFKEAENGKKGIFALQTERLKEKNANLLGEFIFFMSNKLSPQFLSISREQSWVLWEKYDTTLELYSDANYAFIDTSLESCNFTNKPQKSQILRSTHARTRIPTKLIEAWNGQNCIQISRFLTESGLISFILYFIRYQTEYMWVSGLLVQWN